LLPDTLAGNLCVFQVRCLAQLRVLTAFQFGSLVAALGAFHACVMSDRAGPSRGVIGILRKALQSLVIVATSVSLSPAESQPIMAAIRAAWQALLTTVCQFRLGIHLFRKLEASGRVLNLHIHHPGPYGNPCWHQWLVRDAMRVMTRRNPVHATAQRRVLMALFLLKFPRSVIHTNLAFANAVVIDVLVDAPACRLAVVLHSSDHVTRVGRLDGVATARVNILKVVTSPIANCIGSCFSHLHGLESNTPIICRLLDSQC
jgi:hypothetical protein